MARMLDEPDEHGEQQTYTFQTLEPPRVPTDLIASALLVRLEDIDMNHHRRKLRLTAQILYFNPQASVLLLSAYPRRTGQSTPTLLVDVAVPFLGQSPAAKSVYPEDNVYSRQPAPPSVDTRIVDSGRPVKGTAREMLKVPKGEWVHVVGWLEGNIKVHNREINELYDASIPQNPTTSIDPHQYARPCPIVLEAISITQARPPPHNAVYRNPAGSRDSVEVE